MYTIHFFFFFFFLSLDESKKKVCVSVAKSTQKKNPMTITEDYSDELDSDKTFNQEEFDSLLLLIQTKKKIFEIELKFLKKIS